MMKDGRGVSLGEVPLFDTGMMEEGSDGGLGLRDGKRKKDAGSLDLPSDCAALQRRGVDAEIRYCCIKDILGPCITAIPGSSWFPQVYF